MSPEISVGQKRLRTHSGEESARRAVPERLLPVSRHRLDVTRHLLTVTGRSSAGHTEDDALLLASRTLVPNHRSGVHSNEQIPVVFLYLDLPSRVPSRLIPF